MLRDHAFFINSDSNNNNYLYPSYSAKPGGGGANDSVERVQELEDEVRKLKDELARAKGVNDVMWEGVVKAMVNQANAKVS